STNLRPQLAGTGRVVGHRSGNEREQRGPEGRQDDRGTASGSHQAPARWHHLRTGLGEGGEQLMSSFTSDLLDSVTSSPPQQAWGDIAKHLWEIYSAPIPPAAADAEVVKRDRGISELENTISGSCWDLWNEFETSVRKASDEIVAF